MQKTSVRKVGNSFGVTLPKTVVENYHLEEGEQLNIIETREGILITPYQPEFRVWLEAYESTNKRFRNTLRALAE